MSKIMMSDVSPWPSELQISLAIGALMAASDYSDWLGKIKSRLVAQI